MCINENTFMQPFPMSDICLVHAFSHSVIRLIDLLLSYLIKESSNTINIFIHTHKSHFKEQNTFLNKLKDNLQTYLAQQFILDIVMLNIVFIYISRISILRFQFYIIMLLVFLVLIQRQYYLLFFYNLSLYICILYIADVLVDPFYETFLVWSYIMLYIYLLHLVSHP